MITHNEIDTQVNEAIDIRYSNTELSAELGEKILKLSTDINYFKGIAYANSIIGFTSHMLNNSEKSIKHYIDALSYFDDNTNELGYSLTANGLANYYDVIGDYNKALEFANNGHNYAKINNFKEFEAELLSTKGLIYSRISDYNKALESHKEALIIRKELGLIYAEASSLNLIARTNVLLKNYAEAEKYYQQSITLRKKNNDRGGLIYSYIGIATMFTNLHNIKDAIENYYKANEINNVIENTRAEFLIKEGIAKTYLYNNEFDKAKDNIYPLIDLANTINSKPLLYQAYYLLSEYYNSIGEFATALLYYKNYTNTKEEVLSEDNIKALHQQQAVFEIEQSKKETEIYRLKHVELKKVYKEIKDSINYAEKIQKSLLPKLSVLDNYLSEYFILFKPKDVVSGDYYWFKQINNYLIITAADCTGHGVPGAFMSMLGVSFLNEIVTETKIESADSILNSLRDKVKTALKQEGEIGENKDGMDMALCVINLDTLDLQFSGAYNPLYLIRNNELTQLKADRQPIAIYLKEQPFTLHNYKLEKGDCLYMFSDGYADQFGGPKNRKFMSKNLKNLLIDINTKPMNEQREIMNNTFIDWKMNNEQMDDVIVMGLRM